MYMYIHILKTTNWQNNRASKMESTIRISNMDALLFVLVLEVVLLQMQILERSSTVSGNLNSSLTKVQKQQLNKLLRDRTLVKNVIRQTLIEVAEEGQGFTLHQALNILNKSATLFYTAEMKNDQLKKLLYSTKHGLLTKQYYGRIQLRNYDEIVASLKDEIRDSQINSKAQLCYVDKWMCASANALEIRHQIKPTSLPRQDHEGRVHAEIIRAYELQVKEREEMLQYWKLKYKEDTIKINDHVIQQREKLRMTTARREELQKLYDYHAGEMRAWLTFKKERAARLAREHRSRLAATRIQAWWRGLMVRRALGAFRHLRNPKKSVNKTKKK